MMIGYACTTSRRCRPARPTGRCRTSLTTWATSFRRSSLFPSRSQFRISISSTALSTARILRWTAVAAWQWSRPWNALRCRYKRNDPAPRPKCGSVTRIPPPLGHLLDIPALGRRQLPGKHRRRNEPAMTMTPVPFTNLAAMAGEVWPSIEKDYLACLLGGAYIAGPAVTSFEQEWAAYCGAGHTVGVGNGTDALELTLI